jgi:hypothetical protein
MVLVDFLPFFGDACASMSPHMADNELKPTQVAGATVVVDLLLDDDDDDSA